MGGFKSKRGGSKGGGKLARKPYTKEEMAKRDALFTQIGALDAQSETVSDFINFIEEVDYELGHVLEESFTKSWNRKLAKLEAQREKLEAKAEALEDRAYAIGNARSVKGSKKGGR